MIDQNKMDCTGSVSVAGSVRTGNTVFSDISVLVIDDEKRIRNACLNMLAQDGFSADQAENVETGLNLLIERHYDIILLDLMMPGISGLEALVKIRALHPDTVVIVITGYATLEHSIEAMKNGAFDFISKPFAPNDLRAVLTKAVEFLQTIQDMANERSRVRAVINHLADGVLAADLNNCIALANPAFLKLIGYKGDNVIGKPVEAVIELESIRRMMSDSCVVSGNDPGDLTREVRVESTNTCLRVRCIPFRDRPGRMLGVVTVVNDITSLKMMDQLKSHYVHMVSHEIRSPLNSVLMQMKVLTDGLAGELTEKQEDIIHRATEKLKGLANLSTELLDLSKIESGSVCREKDIIDIPELLLEEVNFYLPKAQEKNLVLSLAQLPPLPRIPANRMGIEEVVSNLITNAINYTPEGGKIEVNADADEAYLHIRVTDNGLGIPEHDREHIFERFYRVKNKETRYIIGTGLGLAIVKSIVQAHEGSIQLESVEGQGSSFTVILPIASSSESISLPMQPPSGNTGL
ncbi:MAG: response regulator [Desulfobacteraceae bacterium]|nr:response regulator [Desulfobacteraceae bacterium]